MLKQYQSDRFGVKNNIKAIAFVQLYNSELQPPETNTAMFGRKSTTYSAVLGNNILNNCSGQTHSDAVYTVDMLKQWHLSDDLWVRNDTTGKRVHTANDKHKSRSARFISSMTVPARVKRVAIR